MESSNVRARKILRRNSQPNFRDEEIEPYQGSNLGTASCQRTEKK